MFSVKKKMPVTLLGATGLVGQHFVSLLADHPWFELVALCAIDARVGQFYGEAVDWQMKTPLPQSISAIKLSKLDSDHPSSLVFSALPSNIAYSIELKLASMEKAVISNASAHRWSEHVPNVVAEVNSAHLAMIKKQNFGKGFIVTNPNCTVSGLSIALKPLHQVFTITQAVVVTMQAISGAGKHPTLKQEIEDNLIPFIADEERKIEKETTRLLGQWNGKEMIDAAICLSAHCHRVAVSDGHSAAVSLSFKHKPTLSQIRELWQEYPSEIKDQNLPSAPKRLIIYQEEENRPQPKLDRLNEKGMGVSIGRLRECHVHDYKFNLLVHNNIRGSAGSALLNAEYLLKKGYFL